MRAAQVARNQAAARWEKQTCLSCKKHNRIDLESVRTSASGDFSAKCGYCAAPLRSGITVSQRFFCVQSGSSNSSSDCSVCGTHHHSRVDYEVRCEGCEYVQQLEEGLFERNGSGLLVARCQNCVLVRLFSGSGTHLILSSSNGRAASLLPVGTIKPPIRVRSSEIKYFKIRVHNRYREDLIELNPRMSSFFKLENV